MWFNDFRDPDWLAECLVTSLDGFRRIFSHRPEASRFGYDWLNQTAVHMLTANGVRYDLTIEPGRAASRVYDDPLATDLLPDFRRALRALPIARTPITSDSRTPIRQRQARCG